MMRHNSSSKYKLRDLCVKPLRALRETGFISFRPGKNHKALVSKTAYIIICCLLSFNWIGCEKFETINTNPNAPTITNPDFLLTESLVKGAGQFGSGIHTEIWTLMLWTQQMADINGVPQAGQEYAYGGSYSDEQWRAWYSSVLSNTSELQKLTTNEA